MGNADECRGREDCDGEGERASQVGNAFHRDHLRVIMLFRQRGERHRRSAQKPEREGWESLGTECHEP